MRIFDNAASAAAAAASLGGAQVRVPSFHMLKVTPEDDVVALVEGGGVWRLCQSAKNQVSSRRSWMGARSSLTLGVAVATTVTAVSRGRLYVDFEEAAAAENRS